MLRTRRNLLLATASVAALISSSAVYAVAPTDFFHETKGKKPASFEEAHSMVKKIVYSQIEYGQKFGIKHDDHERAQIEQRIWDHAQYLLSEHYYPKEARLDAPSPDQRGGGLSPGVAQEPTIDPTSPARSTGDGTVRPLNR